MQLPYYPNDPAGLRILPDTSSFAYNAVGNLTRADNADARVRRGYTLNGQVSHDTLAIRSYATPSFSTTVFVTHYTYDRTGRRKWMRVPSQIAPGVSVDYAYDVNGLLRVVRDPSSRRYNHGYDNARRLGSLDIAPVGAPPRVNELYTYDDDDRLIRRRRTLSAGVGGVVSSDTLRYDARGKLLYVGRQTRVAAIGYERIDLAYSGLGAVVAQERSFGANQWQIEEFRADPLGHVYWSQTKSLANSNQLEQRSQFSLQSGALTSRAAAFPQNPTGNTIYPDEVTATTEGSGGVIRTGEVQRLMNGGTWLHYAATRTYYSADGQTRVVQRYHVNPTSHDGVYEEYRYDALGRRVLLRSRKPTSPPAGGGTLSALCTAVPCASAISRWIWDGAQLVGETRAPGQDGLSAGALDPLTGSPPHYGIVGYLHAGGWDEPRGLMDGRVFNPNWRGLPESSQLADVTAPDCSFGLGGSCITVAWPTDVGTYFRRAVPPTTSPPTPTWLGSLAANGATGSGRLHRRFREYDPATGQFTQEDPIGLAGGANLYGFANGDPVNLTDPLGLVPLGCPPLCDHTDPSKDRFIRTNDARVATAAATVVLGAGAAPMVASGGAALLARVAGAAPAAAGAGKALSDARATLPEGAVVLAVVRSGRIVAQTADIMMSHARLVEKTFSSGTPPPGTWVGTVGKLGGEIITLNSKTVMGNQAAAPAAIQTLMQTMFK